MKHRPLRERSATRLRPRAAGNAGSETVTEAVAEETAIALLYNARPYAVMMATPQDLDDFAWGFSLSEGIVAAPSELEIVDRLHTDRGISLEMLIPQRRYDALGNRERNLTGRTGCGLCGTGALADAIRPVARVQHRARWTAETLLTAFDQLQSSQPLNDLCGGLHAAALLTSGNELLVREDIGRHNAVDKVLGAAARAGHSPQALLVTSRASYEIVHKAAQLQCPLVAAISAPTALAIELAEQAGITLLGFARGDRITQYTDGARAAAGRVQTLA